MARELTDRSTLYRIPQNGSLIARCRQLQQDNTSTHCKHYNGRKYKTESEQMHHKCIVEMDRTVHVYQNIGDPDGLAPASLCTRRLQANHMTFSGFAFLIRGVCVARGAAYANGCVYPRKNWGHTV